MPTQLTIADRTFACIRQQRSGLSLYKSADAYLRLGASERIAREIETHRRMLEAGYPVAKIIAEGTIADGSYFIEESLGDKTFRTLFEEDIQREGTITAAHWDELVAITERYLRAQIRSTIPADGAAFACGVHLDLIVKELNQYSISLPDKFNRILQKLSDFPYVFSHGDFNAANMFPSGIIDFEDAFPAPFGFDAVTVLANIEWFPLEDTYEYYARYRFTNAQKEAYLTMCDGVAKDVGLPPISFFYDDFIFCRAIWSTVRMHEWPKLQAWRYNKFIKTFLYN